jgi:hypothetical protein
VRPDEAAFHELQFLVRNLVDELAGFRRRALAAESRLRELETQAPADGNGAGAAASPTVPTAVVPARVAELEGENAMLRARLESAADRTRRMLERVRFLRQQHAAAGER